MFLNKINKAFLCVTLILCSFVYTQDVTIDFGAVDTNAGTMDIAMTNAVDVAGFQFNVTGVTLTSGTAGDLSNTAGFTVSAGANTVIGFSLTGTVIPAGSDGLIASLTFTADADDACFETVTFSDAAGVAITDVAIGDCTMVTEPVLGCTDMDACNYDEAANQDDDSCWYADENYDCNGDCTVAVDCFGVCGGMAMLDCAGNCDGSSVEDDCGVCDGSNTTGCTASISLGSYDETTMMMDVLVSVGPDPLAGFQFNVSGLTGVTAFGGIAGDAGWTVSASDEVVLGFDLQGTTIAAGTSGVLTTLMATATDAESCMSAVVMSDADGAAIAYEVGDCVPLCDDVDMDGVCDDVDDCVGDYDDCDVCNGDGTSCLNVIYFGAVTESADGNTMEVWLSTVDEVAGFQFDVLGAELTGASGGVEDLGWTVNFNADGTVLGFDLAGSVIAAGSTALLTTLSFEINEFDACLDFGTGAISDSTGSALPSGTGDCYTYMTAVGGCTDMAACNYDETANVDQGCEYAEENFDCNGDCTVAVDCAGVCGGSSEFDECGVCDGSGPEENFDCDGNCLVDIDCAGVCGGDSVVDECGVCDGDGIADGACDCDGNVEDCAGECGGSAMEDECGECNGDGASYECSDGSIVCDISGCATELSIGFGAFTMVDESTYSLEVTYSSTENIAGFQWTLDGPLLIGAAGGDAEAAGFEVSTSELGIVIGFSLTGATVSAGEGILTNLWVQGVANESEACLTDVVISDSAGGAFDEVTVGACADVSILSNTELPSDYSLLQNYPNPFNPVTNISFSVAEPGDISLKVYDISGKEVSELINGFYTPGNYNVKWDAIDSYGNQLSSGIYIYQLNTKNGILSNRMVLMR